MVEWLGLPIAIKYRTVRMASLVTKGVRIAGAGNSRYGRYRRTNHLNLNTSRIIISTFIDISSTMDELVCRKLERSSFPAAPKSISFTPHHHSNGLRDFSSFYSCPFKRGIRILPVNKIPIPFWSTWTFDQHISPTASAQSMWCWLLLYWMTSTPSDFIV